MIKTIGKVLAVLAIVGLVASSFALGVGAQVTTDVSHATPLMPHFYRDLTVGSTGADVMALQGWLIGRSFAIPAGATGYFGVQTRAALAKYQASESISPSVGYFGPITRARVLSLTQGPAPEPDTDDEDEDDNDVSKAEAREALMAAEDEFEDAHNEVEEANDDGRDINDAEELLEEAQDRLLDAEDAIVYGENDEAVNFIEKAEDLIGEALDEIEEADDEDTDEKVSTSAAVTRVTGVDNDYATFEIEVELSAFGEDIYIDQDEDVSFEYEIQDSDGNEVMAATRNDAFLESSADEEGDYYVVEERDSERFTLTVVFDPFATDEGELYRLQLLGINYADSEQAPEDTWLARPASEYRTKSVLIAD